MAVQEGSKAAKGFNIIKGHGGVRKLRCQYDQENTISMPDGKGGLQEQCPACKRVYRSTVI